MSLRLLAVTVCAVVLVRITLVTPSGTVASAEVSTDEPSARGSAPPVLAPFAGRTRRSLVEPLYQYRPPPTPATAQRHRERASSAATGVRRDRAC